MSQRIEQVVILVLSLLFMGAGLWLFRASVQRPLQEQDAPTEDLRQAAEVICLGVNEGTWGEGAEACAGYVATSFPVWALRNEQLPEDLRLRPCRWEMTQPAFCHAASDSDVHTTVVLSTHGDVLAHVTNADEAKRIKELELP